MTDVAVIFALAAEQGCFEDRLTGVTTIETAAGKVRTGTLEGRTVSTIGEEKRLNPRFSDRTREQFITIMSNLNLAFPKKMNEAVPANEYCGDFIPQDSVANLVINQDQKEIELTVQKNTEIYNDYFTSNCCIR